MIQTLDTMMSLFENNIVHDDLACRNAVLIFEGEGDSRVNWVKLIDFAPTRERSMMKMDILVGVKMS